MKKILLSILSIAIIGCKIPKTDEVVQPDSTIKSITDNDLETAVIYEANIRQYSEEGSFNAFTADVPKLKALGVKVIWLMPVFPISEAKRKGPLGSYYAVSDYTKLNSEFGSIEDFRALVKTIHDNDMFVILDWVPNHTGWDHSWIANHPDFYTHNAEGEIIHPEGTDWTDVADLNYDNIDMQEAMIADMMYWVEKENIDGFRCDVASEVPTTFWEKAIPRLRAKYSVFMLAEAEKAELNKDPLFDMSYAWSGHHLLNQLAKGEANAEDLKKYVSKINKTFEANDMLMNFVTNHDENSWNGTIEERMGVMGPALTVLSYTLPGMPLIYSGQEYGMNHRLKFFEKDQIPKTKGVAWQLLEQLAVLKQNPALHGGKEAADLTFLDTDDNQVIAFTRTKAENEIVVFINLSENQKEIKVDLAGDFKDFFSKSDVTLNKTLVTIPSNSYKVFSRL
jgi:glycosidase